MPFRIALSGLEAATTDLQVTGNNIANAGTNGFKESRAEFADIYANSLQDVSTTSAGRGVRVSRVAQQFAQGDIDFTSNTLDLAINGEGFFVLEDASGNVSYTRAGAYHSDREGYVVDANGNQLQIFEYESVSGNFNTGSTVALQLPLLSGSPNATSDVELASNVDSSEAVPAAAYDPDVPSSYNHSTSTTVYDSLGSPYTLRLDFRKTGALTWDVHAQITDSNGVRTDITPAANEVVFTSAGIVVPGTGDVDVNGNLTFANYTPSNGATALTGVTLDVQNMTQYGGDFSVNDLTQDGYAAGRLSGVDIDDGGVVSAQFTNGQSEILGQVALAKFNNQQGLRQIGDTSWTATYASGDVQLGAPGTSSLGLIQSGGLENSNVDIAEQLVNLITAQRNFQANAQVITTADTITQTIINIR